MKDGRVREDRVRIITTFLSSLPNSHAIFSLLHLMIYERFPASGQGKEEEMEVEEQGEEEEEQEENKEEDSITVSFSTSSQLHSVSSLGLELLALTSREDARHMLHKVKVGWVSSFLLLSLASLKGEQITELEVQYRGGG